MTVIGDRFSPNLGKPDHVIPSSGSAKFDMRSIIIDLPLENVILKTKEGVIEYGSSGAGRVEARYRTSGRAIGARFFGNNSKLKSTDLKLFTRTRDLVVRYSKNVTGKLKIYYLVERPRKKLGSANLAVKENASNRFPIVTASYTSRYDDISHATDGIISYSADSPHNRWTCYESSNKEDWLAVTFKHPKKVSRLKIFIYSDGEGVTLPLDYWVEYRSSKGWTKVSSMRREAKFPVVEKLNECSFKSIETSSVRVVFKNSLPGKSGVTELEIYAE